jgi:hypothetical protein
MWLPGFDDQASRGEAAVDQVRPVLDLLHHKKRTTATEELARRIRAFQRDLRHLESQTSATTLTAELLPYALHFGMARSDESLALFAHTFLGAFAGLDGWHPSVPERPDFQSLDEQASKPTIREQIMSPGVIAAVWAHRW